MSGGRVKCELFSSNAHFWILYLSLKPVWMFEGRFTVQYEESMHFKFGLSACTILAEITLCHIFLQRNLSSDIYNTEA